MSGTLQLSKTSFLRLEVDAAKLKKYGVTKSGLRRHMRESLEAMGRHWHEHFLEEHFQESAYARYGYYQRKGMDKVGIRERAIARLTRRRGHAPSSAQIDAEAAFIFNRTYTRRKERQFHHNRPLAFTGGAMLEALGPIKLRGSSKQIRVVLPSKFNFSHPNSRIRMRDEVTRLIPSEVVELLDVGRQALRDAIARPQ